MREIYVPADEKQQAVKKLLDLGVNVTATDGDIVFIEIDTDSHNVNNLETLTGLKFEKGKKPEIK